MSSAHRPTWAPAQGKEGRQNSRSFSARDIAAHTKLKFRQPGQGTASETSRRDLKAELLAAEREAAARKAKGERGYVADQKLLALQSAQDKEESDAASESAAKRRKLLQEAADLDKDDSDADESDEEENGTDRNRGKAVEAPNNDDDDSDSSDDDDEDETAELLRELEKIKKERAEEKERQVRGSSSLSQASWLTVCTCRNGNELRRSKPRAKRRSRPESASSSFSCPSRPLTDHTASAVRCSTSRPPWGARRRRPSSRNRARRRSGSSAAGTTTLSSRTKLVRRTSPSRSS